MRTAMLAVAVLALVVHAETPRFAAPEPVYSAGVQIDVGYYGAPLMFDWDMDSAKDLVCGQYAYGYISLYRNTGPDSAPAFNGFEYFYADGSQIALPYG